ncbi:hypothetical protein ACIRD2_33460 [Streptomyces sp. NPDC093595]|uniref:hypothetical protein n=1 Tax=Streptomyces sp. NPDC093595 TaxID=3366045 RepID=UPI0037FEF607
MPTDPVPAGPIDTEPRGFLPYEQQRAELLAVLADAGVELGTYDERIVDWMAKWEWSTVATIASWVKRASDPA